MNHVASYEVNEELFSNSHSESASHLKSVKSSSVFKSVEYLFILRHLLHLAMHSIGT